MIRTYDGDCPHTGTPQTISVYYDKIVMTGTLTSNYKRMKFECPHKNECLIEQCPIYQNIPKSIRV